MATGAVGQGLRGTMGEEKYESARSNATWGWAAFNGFLPFNPLLWPLKLGLFLVWLIFIVWFFDLGWARAPVAAWLFSSLMITVMVHSAIDKIGQYGFGL